MFGGLLTELTPEATCLACHGPLGIAREVSIHGPSGQITCLECHNPHNNNRLNVLGGSNIMLIGMEYDANNPGTALALPQIREETATGLGPLKDVVFSASPADWHRPGDSYGVCNACHLAIHHAGEDCSACHAHSGGFVGLGCSDCHNGSGAGALAVSAASPHSVTATGYSCEGCHVGHGAGTVEIPNNSSVGINYGSNGETGISLGSATATGATEAEICWNCHDLTGISEWGTNSRVATGNSPYNFGSLNQSNWTTAIWSSTIFVYKSGAIQSTHSANSSATKPGVDPVASIRCSYCHDVHELALAPNDSKMGKPYLRGSWKGNPYREDGAPQSGTIYLDGERFGMIPRGGTQYIQMGGYQIDQNNGNPTVSWTLSNSGGLCTLCHGSNVDSMNKFDVDEAGFAETTDMSWVGTNGHSAAVLGGTGSVAANIFTNSNRGSANPGTGDPDVLNGPMAYQKSNGATGNGFGPGDSDGGTTTAGTRMGSRGGDAGPQGIAPNAKYTDTSEVQHRGTTYFNWGVTVDNATIDASYHKFSCSKCHNPHASRLPRLMITNCLDTKHNSWDNGKYKEGTTTYLTPLATYGNNTGKSLSNTTTAQNCHRLGGDDLTDTKDAAGAGSGWNNVTPW